MLNKTQDRAYTRIKLTLDVTYEHLWSGWKIEGDLQRSYLKPSK